MVPGPINAAVMMIAGPPLNLERIIFLREVNHFRGIILKVQ